MSSPICHHIQKVKIMITHEALEKCHENKFFPQRRPWLNSFLRVLCVRDQKEMFWHTLVGWLGPPAALRRQGDDDPGHLHDNVKT